MDPFIKMFYHHQARHTSWWITGRKKTQTQVNFYIINWDLQRKPKSRTVSSIQEITLRPIALSWPIPSIYLSCRDIFLEWKAPHWRLFCRWNANLDFAQEKENRLAATMWLMLHSSVVRGFVGAALSHFSSFYSHDCRFFLKSFVFQLAC